MEVDSYVVNDMRKIVIEMGFRIKRTSLFYIALIVWTYDLTDGLMDYDADTAGVSRSLSGTMILMIT